MGFPQIHDDADALADRIVRELGGRIVLGLPLGLGKANRIANAIYRMAAADRSISLDIFTALTLEPPAAGSDMERRFLQPFADRLYGDYERLDYAMALRRGELPDNIRVSEFFLQAGNWLGVAAVQQNYISANYTHAARMLLDKGVNVIAQLVAKRDEQGDPAYSLSCNTDITLDILPELRTQPTRCFLVGEVSRELPFMAGEAVVPASAFAHLLDTPESEPALFVVPKQPISEADHAIGIHAASLVKDGGTVQIGIGSLGDALTAALIMRHRAPDIFAQTLANLCGGSLPSDREIAPFNRGLYAASEMFVDGFMELYRAGILKRTAADGAVLHAGFFLGTRDFYRFLRELPKEEHALFQMRGISFVNELYGDEDGKRRDRTEARFINNAMMATLLGETVSDGLENGKVVSGPGGQYNFVAQAFALEGARSIMTLNSTRKTKGSRRSRIRWSYGHATIPRHLRDVFVTEYGVADLRGKSDRDCIVSMLALADAEFQGELLTQARTVDKIDSGYAPPASLASNSPETISQALAVAQRAGYCAAYPFGTEFTPVEQRLLPALSLLKDRVASTKSLLSVASRAFLTAAPARAWDAELQRMGLDRPRTPREHVSKRLLVWALTQTHR